MKLTLDGKPAKIPAGKKAATVAELLAALGVNAEEALVKVNGKLAPNNAKILPKDDVKVMRVIFGG